MARFITTTPPLRGTPSPAKGTFIWRDPGVKPRDDLSPLPRPPTLCYGATPFRHWRGILLPLPRPASPSTPSPAKGTIVRLTSTNHPVRLRFATARQAAGMTIRKCSGWGPRSPTPL
ncbi:MAG: hypothetical protein LBB23_02660 [Rickettsiales bacterium]|nr:hypothetical protein [Rickettsiales bacterium]